MRKSTSFGLLFLAAASVYEGRAVGAALGAPAAPGNGEGRGTLVSPLPNSPDPATRPAAKVAAAPVPAAAAAPDAPLVDPTATPAVPATQPGAGTEGRSVSADQINFNDGAVEIHVNDANLIEVLRMLSMQSQTNILPSKEVRGTVTANLYGVTIKEALDAILRANGYEYRQKGNVVYVYSAKEFKEVVDSERQMNTEVFHLFYTPAANAMTMIKPVLSPAGQAAVSTPATSGIDSSGKDTGGNSHAVEDMMVITDYPENLEKVRKLLKELDKRPQQILVEATVLRASLTDNNALGVDFQLLGGVNFAGVTSAAGQFTGVATGASGTGTIDPQKGVISSGGTGNNFTQGINGLRVGVVTNNIAIFLSALEEVTHTTVLANPKVLVLNKQKGEVKVARQDPFRGKTTVNENGLSQQEVQFLETGTLLIFRPYIGDDGFIRMEVHPEDSSPLQSTAADLPPTKLTTETTTNIMVKDGHTVVIGGMFRETAQSARSQTPFLGNIPVLGNLFRKQTDSTQREEVIILLTPHIIKDEQAYSNLSEKERADAERLRVGVRRGMMPFSRERLAEFHYERAVAEWNKPNPDRCKVLWNLNCATNLNPTFLEAIELKEKVTGREVTASDNSSIRTLMQRQILAERASGATGATAPASPATIPAGGQAAAVPATLPTPVESQAAMLRRLGPGDFAAAAPAATQPALAQGPATRPAAGAQDEARALVEMEDDGEAVAEAEYLKGATAEQQSPAGVVITDISDTEVKDGPSKSDK